MKKIFYFFLIFSFTFLILNSNPAWAITVRIDRPKVRLSITPGGNKSGVINIENPSEKTMVVGVYLEDWLYNSTADGSKGFYPPDSTPLSCAKWITFAPAEFSIPPYGKQALNYTVNCPADAGGGHYAVMFFETSLGEARGEEGVSVLVLGRLGSLFCIEPEGTIKRVANLNNLSIVRNKGIDIKMDFENTGNVDITTEGTFYIMDEEGIIAARGEFSKAYTLPGDKAVISSNIPEESAAQIASGEYDLIVTIDLGGIPKVLETKLKIKPSGKISYPSLTSDQRNP